MIVFFLVFVGLFVYFEGLDFFIVFYWVVIIMVMIGYGDIIF